MLVLKLFPSLLFLPSFPLHSLWKENFYLKLFWGGCEHEMYLIKKQINVDLLWSKSQPRAPRLSLSEPHPLASLGPLNLPSRVPQPPSAPLGSRAELPWMDDIPTLGFCDRSPLPPHQVPSSYIIFPPETSRTEGFLALNHRLHMTVSSRRVGTTLAWSLLCPQHLAGAGAQWVILLYLDLQGPMPWVTRRCFVGGQPSKTNGERTAQTPLSSCWL